MAYRKVVNAASGYKSFFGSAEMSDPRNNLYDTLPAE
jgi:hypothetical protein